MSLTSIDILPPQSWDTHVHVFDPAKHPYIPETPYSPPTRTAGHLVKECPSHNYVIVMSIPEGTSTEHTVEAIASLRAMGRNGRGTVIMDLDDMTVGALRKLDSEGVRSIRGHVLRIAMKLGEGQATVEKWLELAAEKLHEAGLSWSIDAQLSLSTWAALTPTLLRINEQYGTVFVADHLFCTEPSLSESEDLTHILTLVEKGILYVKISGLARYSPTGPYAMREIIEKVLKCRQGKMALWGSDWPHVLMGPGGRLGKVSQDGQLMCLKEICQGLGEGYWEALTRDNAAALYA